MCKVNPKAARRVYVIAAAVAVFLGWTTSLAADTITIRALIDGTSRLHLQGDTAQWHHIHFQAPGLFDGANEPTTINGFDWYPIFSSPYCTDCWSSVYSGMSPAMPTADIPYELTIIEGRESATIYELPSAANGYTLVIELNDFDSPGAAWYEVEIEFTASCDLFLHVPIEDGQTWIHNCDDQINGVVLSDFGCPVVERIHWDWGDGSDNASWFPAGHTYEANGTYTVTVTPYDTAGGSVSDTLHVEITDCEPLPAAPGGIYEGLALWLSADHDVWHWNQRVSRWFDQSGNLRHLFQWSESLQPELVESSLNGQDTLRFSVDSMPFDGSFLVGSDYTIFAVEGRDRFGVANFFVGGAETLINGNLVLGYERADLLRQAHYGNDLDATVPAYDGTQEYALTTFSFAQTSGREIHRFGLEFASDTSTQALVSYNSPAVGSFDAHSFFYEGDIAELIFYDRRLPCEERASVELYLAGRFGLSLGYADAFELCGEIAIVEVFADVADLGLDEGTTESLEAKLSAALKRLEDLQEKNDHAAINNLEAFINSVEAQRGKKLTDDEADALIASATEVISFLESI